MKPNQTIPYNLWCNYVPRIVHTVNKLNFVIKLSSKKESLEKMHCVEKGERERELKTIVDYKY